MHEQLSQGAGKCGDFDSVQAVGLCAVSAAVESGGGNQAVSTFQLSACFATIAVGNSEAGQCSQQRFQFLPHTPALRLAHRL
jgi:hypothetical protein